MNADLERALHQKWCLAHVDLSSPCSCGVGHPPTFEVVSTPFGKFQIDTRDIIGSTLKAGTLWDGPGFLQVIAKEYAQFGEWGQTILDVGANLGSFSVYCAAMGAWRVVAVEPVAATYQQLQANLDLNKAVCGDAVIPLRIAAYDRLGTLVVPLLDPGNPGGVALRRLRPGDDLIGTDTVQARQLDEYRHLYGTHVSLIKIDAQGCDGAAIMGLQQTLQRDHPAVVFEWEADLATEHTLGLDDVLHILHGYGYTTHEWPSHPGNYLAVVR